MGKKQLSKDVIDCCKDNLIGLYIRIQIRKLGGNIQ